MAKEVILLNYWMPLLRGLKDFQEIAKAEEPELRYLLEACDRTLNNMFIETADEYGIIRYENIMGLVPDIEDTLDTRRFKVLSKWNDKVPYTDRELYNRLLSLCGAGNFQIKERYKEYKLDIETTLGVRGAFDEVCKMLDLMLPCNLIVAIFNYIKVQKGSSCYFGGIVCVAMAYQITNDINCEYLSRNTAYLSNATAYAGTALITHDIAEQDNSSMALRGAVGLSTAHTLLITNDIRVQQIVTGNPTVAIPVSTATVITN